ncbi:MAG: hypothetical protein IKS08_02700 [Alphaproteobacteria bacterium]|jgi:hypothetical protein|nr:hypothetical protein [Alphaproteobacteria bacterium]
MKTVYKIIIACIITAIITGFVTAYITSEYYLNIPDAEFTCKDNASPDINGCCPGEELKDMGDLGFNCCPLDGGDCFPPIMK